MKSENVEVSVEFEVLEKRRIRYEHIAIPNMSSPETPLRGESDNK
jgi:hypothetical protein